MKKFIEDLTITENRRLNDQFFILKASSGRKLPLILPGQFLQVLVTDSPSTFLRRPISVHDIDTTLNTVSMLVQVAGEGTRHLSAMKEGDRLNVVFPLGNSFTLPSAGQKVLLSGGGCGIAPLLFLGRKVKEAGVTPVFALGFRSRSRVIEYDDFMQLGEVNIATQDGSLGMKGLVTDLPVFRDREWDMVYCCGPDQMMKAVASICSERNIPCEVSLENLMACGFGVCLCCVVQTTSGHVCTCTDGPVFNTQALKWQI